MQFFGIETEYGISVDGAQTEDLVEASRAVVDSFEGIYAAPWNYQVEAPRHDMREFDAKKLARDPQDAKFDRPSSQALSNSEDRNDRVLSNGARLYNDHGHPEYATPECRYLLELVTHDKAGEKVLLQCAQNYTKSTGKTVHLIKNNGDFHGASYGCHESYLMKRALDWEDALPTIAAFLATRIVFAGAGKVCRGNFLKGDAGRFQLSQRADFIKTLQSVDTLYNRPLVNTRDEPHADAGQYRRLHVICGDANMSEFATALKVGTTRFMVQLLESGWRLPFALKDPVKAIQQISQDTTCQETIKTTDGKEVTAIEVQKYFFEAAGNLDNSDDKWTLREWQKVLSDLEQLPELCHDRVDWVAKKVLLEEFARQENLDWNKDNETLQSLDIAYADIDPENGLYYGLVESGQMRTFVEAGDVEEAMTTPPCDTRATLRGFLVRRFAREITGISWDTVLFGEAENPQQLRLPDVMPQGVMEKVCRAKSLDEVRRLL